MGKLTKGWRKVRKSLHLTSKNKVFKGLRKSYHFSTGNNSAGALNNYAETLNSSSGLADANTYYHNMSRTINTLT